jgi:large subunit ribosomal protein L35
VELELAGARRVCYTLRLGPPRAHRRGAVLHRPPGPDTGRHRTEPGLIMPKLKTHKGLKKRFKVSATGKVSHKRCGSSHLMSHKSGKQVRRLRKKVQLSVSAEAARVRKAVRIRISSQPDAILAARLCALRDIADAAEAAAATPTA